MPQEIESRSGEAWQSNDPAIRIATGYARLTGVAQIYADRISGGDKFPTTGIYNEQTSAGRAAIMLLLDHVPGKMEHAAEF